MIYKPTRMKQHTKDLTFLKYRFRLHYWKDTVNYPSIPNIRIFFDDLFGYKEFNIVVWFFRYCLVFRLNKSQK